MRMHVILRPTGTTSFVFYFIFFGLHIYENIENDEQHRKVTRQF